MPETIRLLHPLRIVDSGARGPTRERIISEVTLRDPTARELLLIERHQGQPMLLALALIQALSGLTKGQVAKLAVPDVERLSRTVLDSVNTVQIASVIERTRGLSQLVADDPA